MAGFILDVSENKHSLNRLIESENKFHDIFQNSPEGIFIERILDRTIVDANPAYEKILGVEKSELIGKRLDQLGIETSEEVRQQIVDEFLSTGGLQNKDVPLTRRDGSVAWTEVSAKKAIINGEECFLCFVSDRTHIKAYETQLKRGLENTIAAISTAAEKRDSYTAGHQYRVEQIAALIAKEMGLKDEDIHPIKLAASIHDIGKINIPAEILSKPGRLSAIEFELIKSHSQVGYDIVKDIDFPWPIAEMILQHHERIDGSGYPYGLTGEQILPGAKIIGVADVIEAMASHRPYRAALGVEVALEEVSKNSGILYDSAVARAAVAVMQEHRFQFDWTNSR